MHICCEGCLPVLLNLGIRLGILKAWSITYFTTMKIFSCKISPLNFSCGNVEYIRLSGL